MASREPSGCCGVEIARRLARQKQALVCQQGSDACRNQLGVPVSDSVTATLWHALHVARTSASSRAGVATGTLRKRFQAALTDLLAATSADHTTLRIDLPEQDMHVRPDRGRGHRTRSPVDPRGQFAGPTTPQHGAMAGATSPPTGATTPPHRPDPTERPYRGIRSQCTDARPHRIRRCPCRLAIGTQPARTRVDADQEARWPRRPHTCMRRCDRSWASPAREVFPDTQGGLLTWPRTFKSASVSTSTR